MTAVLNSPVLSHVLSFTVSLTVDASVDLLISDSPPTVLPIQNPGPAAPTAATHRITSPTKPAATAMKQSKPTPTTTTQQTTTSQQLVTTARTTVQPTTPVTQGTTQASDTRVKMGPRVDASPTAVTRNEPKTRLSWTESPVDQPKTTKKPGRHSSVLPE